jgi:hypothetical protein
VPCFLGFNRRVSGSESRALHAQVVDDYVNGLRYGLNVSPNLRFLQAIDAIKPRAVCHPLIIESPSNSHPTPIQLPSNSHPTLVKQQLLTFARLRFTRTYDLGQSLVAGNKVIGWPTAFLVTHFLLIAHFLPLPYLRGYRAPIYDVSPYFMYSWLDVCL